MDPMEANPNPEEALREILARFDADNKQDVARRLVEELGLERLGPPYQEQVRDVLQRELTSSEAFKLRILNNTYNYESGGAGEEEEEEE